MTGIREARSEDVDELSRIVCLCYEGFRKTDNYPSRAVVELMEERGSLECIRDLISNEVVFVADDENAIKGMISINKNEVTKLYVHPAFHRKGIGRQLFLYAESFIKSGHFQRMFLGVAVQTAIPFYERMGMKIIETRTVGQGPCSGMVLAILEKVFDG